MDLKKILALLISLAMAICMFTACGDTENGGENAENGGEPSDEGEQMIEDITTGIGEPKLIIDGEEVNTDGLVMMTIDGIEVPFDEYRYMYLFVDNARYSAGSMSYWDAHPEEFVNLLALTEGQLLENHWGQMLAEKNGVSLTEDDEKEVDEYMQSQRDSFESEEEYETALTQSGLTEDLLRRIMIQRVYCDRAYTDLYLNEGAPLAPSDEEIKEGLAENYRRVYHVLVSNDHFAEDEEYADADDETLKAAALEYANTLLERIKNGEDIYTLAQEADDPGMVGNAEGYFFTYGEMVEPFEKAAFELEVGEISDIVETDYGYHIIQRLEQDQYTEDNWDGVRELYIQDVFNSDVDDMLANADVEYWEDFDKLTFESIK